MSLRSIATSILCAGAIAVLGSGCGPGAELFAATPAKKPSSIIDSPTSTATPTPSRTVLRVSEIFGSSMVLQHKQSNPVWGWGSPGAKVTIRISTASVQATVKADSSWRAVLPAVEAGGPYDMTISAGSDSLKLTDILVGEVWLCSGQSNMEMPVGDWGKVLDWEKELAAAHYPNIRLFIVDKVPSAFPQTRVRGSGWRTCSPQSVEKFSAAAYFFGRDVHRRNAVPVGLIQSAWTGSYCQNWVSGPALVKAGIAQAEVTRLAKFPHTLDSSRAYYQQQEARWRADILANDAGRARNAPRWESSDLDTKAWKPIATPGYWEKIDTSMALFDGVVWLRRQITLPPSWNGTAATLTLGNVDDWDSTWVNGVPVGGMEAYATPRVYLVPPTALKAGVNVIAVRCTDTYAGGGFGGKPSDMALVSGTDTMRLSGQWLYRVGVDFAKYPMPRPTDWPFQASVLYNGMISPLVGLGMRGVIWYQGESNVDWAEQYRTLFPLLITDWRTRWGEGDFPFLYVQLANYMQRSSVPAESDWAELRESQLKTLSVPNTGMAVTIDVGDSIDIHPKNKRAVGERLALLAAVKAYNDTALSSGPIYQTYKNEGTSIRIYFTSDRGGLACQGDTLRGFAIAGADRRFVWANARIDNQTVVVSSSQVSKPVAVRYGWAAHPVCNLANKAGLPASPFRTDAWPGITSGRK